MKVNIESESEHDEIMCKINLGKNVATYVFFRLDKFPNTISPLKISEMYDWLEKTLNAFHEKTEMDGKIISVYVFLWKCKIDWDAKSILASTKRRMSTQKADMGELGEKTITDFLMVPAGDWWKKVTKTLQKMKSKCKNRNIQSIQQLFQSIFCKGDGKLLQRYSTK